MKRIGYALRVLVGIVFVIAAASFFLWSRYLRPIDTVIIPDTQKIYEADGRPVFPFTSNTQGFTVGGFVSKKYMGKDGRLHLVIENQTVYGLPLRLVVRYPDSPTQKRIPTADGRLVREAPFEEIATQELYDIIMIGSQVEIGVTQDPRILPLELGKVIWWAFFPRVIEGVTYTAVSM